MNPFLTKHSKIISKGSQKKFVDNMRTTEDERKKISNYEQGSQKWLFYRRGKITGSKIGAVLGHNFFCNHEKLLIQLLWENFKGNEKTQYGLDNENIAIRTYQNFKKKCVENFFVKSHGLVLHDKKPWLGYSPDGLVFENNNRGLLEIKCPFSKKFYSKIPMYYYDQIQYGMWLLNCEFCDFVVYLPNKLSIERFQYDKEYVVNFMLKRVDSFYFRKYLPLLIAKANNWLLPNTCHLPNGVYAPFFCYDIDSDLEKHQQV